MGQTEKTGSEPGTGWPTDKEFIEEPTMHARVSVRALFDRADRAPESDDEPDYDDVEGDTQAYPDGFGGAVLDADTRRRLAALAAHVHVVREDRAAQISGAMANHRREVGRAWVVDLGGEEIALALDRSDAGSVASFSDDAHVPVICDWKPGDTLARAEVDGVEMAAKVAPIAGGLRLRHAGADLVAAVRPPRHADLVARVPEKPMPDTSRQVRCPMPGLVVRIDVAEGDEVFDGQALAMVEAMKMENVLRAERAGRVARILAQPGDSLGVDDIIMEFE